ARDSVSDSAPADGQSIPNLHADTDGSDLAVGNPRHIVDISGLLDQKVVLVRELSAVVKVANVIFAGEAFLRPSGRYARAFVSARVHPPRIQGSRSVALRVKDEADVGCTGRL